MNANAINVDFGVSVHTKYGNVNTQGRAIDLSSRGMLLQVTSPAFVVGEHLELGFRVAPKFLWVRVVGKVVRADGHEYGIKFVSLYKPDRICLRDSLQHVRGR